MASSVPDVTAAVTNAVVAIAVVFVPPICVTAMVPDGKVGVPVNVGDANGAFNTNAGTVGSIAVPLRSPANCILPVILAVAFGVILFEVPPLKKSQPPFLRMYTPD